jgi:hypothetical protein
VSGHVDRLWSGSPASDGRWSRGRHDAPRSDAHRVPGSW